MTQDIERAEPDLPGLADRPEESEAGADDGHEEIGDSGRPTTSNRVPESPDGGVAGYRADRTLPVGVELYRQSRRRRTRLALAFLAVLPILILAAFELGNGEGAPERDSLVDLATAGGVNFTLFTLFAAAQFLLVVVVALFFGDSVAAEASWSSVKYLLASPVPRSRLLRQKALVAAFLSITGLAILVAVALTVGLLWYGNGSLVLPDGAVLSFPRALLALLGVCAYLTVHLTWIAGLALLLSVSTDAPLGAVGGAVLAAVLSQILDEITALGELRVVLPTHFDHAWTDLLSPSVDWADMANGAFSALAYATVFLVLALIRFRRKDIVS